MEFLGDSYKIFHVTSSERFNLNKFELLRNFRRSNVIKSNIFGECDIFTQQILSLNCFKIQRYLEFELNHLHTAETQQESLEKVEPAFSCF